MRYKQLNVGFYALLAVPLVVWLWVEGNPVDYIRYKVPAGQGLYVLSKLMGMYAFLLLWLHIGWALLRKTPIEPQLPAWSPTQHKRLAWLLLVIIFAHMALFISAVSLRQGAFAATLLLPDFSDYYHGRVGLGVLAVWLAPLVVMMGYRLLSGSGVLRWHRLSYVIFTLTFFHAIGVGSEVSGGVLFVLYSLMCLSIVILFLYRYKQ